MPDGCTIGIDPGERWIGVARAAAGSSLALPIDTLDRQRGEENLAATLSTLIGQQSVETLVVGIPLRSDGREDAQAIAFRRLGERLAASIGAVCVTQDERFSSVPPESPPQARERQDRKTRALGRKSVRRQHRERERSHADAAARILQRWLDSQAGQIARESADAQNAAP